MPTEIASATLFSSITQSGFGFFRNSTASDAPIFKYGVLLSFTTALKVGFSECIHIAFPMKSELSSKGIGVSVGESSDGVNYKFSEWKYL